MNVMQPAGRLDRATAEALAAGRHRTPVDVLGPHDGPAGRIGRAFVAGASSGEGLRRSDGLSLGRLAPGLVPGLFEGPVSENSAYLLRIDWPGAVQETEDPYDFA